MRRMRRKGISALTAFGRSRWLLVLAAVWATLVALFFLWELDGYRGITAAVAEWEYQRFGQHLPWLTFLFLATLFAGPVLLILSILRSRVRPKREPASERLVDQVVRSERALANFLNICASAALIVGLVALIWTAFLPRASGPVRVIQIAGPDATAPADGHVRLSGTILYRRTATFQQDVLMIRRGVQFAPIVPSAASDGPFRYFVEVTADRIGDDDALEHTAAFVGILKRNALPGPIMELFGSAGVPVAQPHYVLYASRASMCWPYYVVAFNCLVAGILFLLLALLQRRRLSQAIARGRQFGADVAPVA